MNEKQIKKKRTTLPFARMPRPIYSGIRLLLQEYKLNSEKKRII